MSIQQEPSQPFVAPDITFSQDFDNLKVIERWANKYMRDVNAADRCILTIPHKQLHDLDASASLDNWVTIERWAKTVIDGSCSTGVGFSRSCYLYIPYKTVLGDLKAGRLTLSVAQEREFDNYKTVENWANRLSRGEC